MAALHAAEPGMRLDWERDGRDWPNRTRSVFVGAGGLRWHAQIAGLGPTLLLLHGTGASTHSWRDLLPLLARHFTVVAPDLPGHAFTGAPAAAGYSMRAFAAAVRALLDSLGMQPAICVGHSAGAAILARMDIDGMLPSRLLVSLNGALLPLDGLPGLVFSPMAKLLARIPQVPRLFAWQAGGSPLVSRLLDDTGSRLDARGAEFYARLARHPAHVGAALKMMAHWDLRALGPALPLVRQRVLLVAGENDRTIPARHAREVAARMAGAALVQLPGLGHLAHEEAPRLVAALLLRHARRAGLLAHERKGRA